MKYKKESLLTMVCLLLAYVCIGIPEEMQSYIIHNSILEKYGYLIVVILSIVGSFTACFIIKKQKFARMLKIFLLIMIATGAVACFALDSEYINFILLFTMGFSLGGLDYICNYKAVTDMQCWQINLMHGFWGIGALLGSFVYKNLSTHTPMFALEMLMVMIVLVIFAILGENTNNIVVSSENTDTVDDVNAKINVVAVVFLLLACFLYNSIQNLISVWGGIFIGEKSGLDSINATKWMGCFYTSMLVFRIIYAVIAIKVSSQYLIRIGQISSMIGIAFLFVPDNTTAMLLGILILGAGCSPIYPNLLYDIKRYFPKKYIGLVILLTVSFVSFAAVAAPAALNILGTDYARWFPCILFLAFIMLSVCCEYLNYQMQTKNNELLQRVSDEAYKDSFTSVMNKNAYLKKLDQLQKNKDIVFTCIYIDINGLHQVNNQFGHATGDELIMRVVQTLQKRFDNNNIYRIGGDEFVIFHFENNEEGLVRYMQEICKELMKHNSFISYGVKARAAGQNVDEVIDEADRVMLQNKVHFYKNNLNFTR